MAHFTRTGLISNARSHGNRSFTVHVLPPLFPELFIVLLQTCKAQGQVVSGANQPLARAQITVSPSSGAAQGAATDQNGQWVIPNLPCASTGFTVERPGYLPVTVPAASINDPLRIMMLAESAVAGSVRDDAAEPVAGAAVELYESVLKDGRRVRRLASTVNADSAGGYRIGQLKPGGYKICASSSRPVWSTTAGEPLHYPEICYEFQTTGIELRQNFTLTPMRAFHVRGVAQGLPGTAHTVIRVGRADSRVANGGRFDIPGILPGAHTIEGLAVLGDQTAFASGSIDVGSADLDNVVLRFAPAVPVAGTLHSDTPLPDGFSQRVTLLSTQSEFSATAEWDSDNVHFAFGRIPSGPYRLLMTQPPPPWYVKSARVNGGEVGDGEFLVNNESSIEIAVGDDPATIAGMADPGVQIVLMRPGYPALTTQAKPDGSIRLANLAPGEYDLYVFDAATEVEYANPSWMQAHAPAPRRIEAGANTVTNILP